MLAHCFHFCQHHPCPLSTIYFIDCNKRKLPRILDYWAFWHTFACIPLELSIALHIKCLVFQESETIWKFSLFDTRNFALDWNGCAWNDNGKLSIATMHSMCFYLIWYFSSGMLLVWWECMRLLKYICLTTFDLSRFLAWWTDKKRFQFNWIDYSAFVKCQTVALRKKLLL